MSTASLKRLVSEYGQSSTIVRAQLPTRLIFSALVTCVVAVLTGDWALALLWYLAVVASLSLSARVHALSAVERPSRRLPTWSPPAASAAAAAVFASGSVPLWFLGGALGPGCSLLLLAGGSLNVLVLQHRQSHVVIAGLAPYVIFLALTPIWAASTHGLEAAFAVLVGVGAFLGNAAMLWRIWMQTLAREQAALSEIERQRREAEAATAAKSAFVAAVTHELRTPLSGLLAASVELQRGAEDPRQVECAAIVADSARFMRSLLGELLDLAKLEAGRMEVEATPFDLRQFGREVGRFWELEARSRGVPFVIETTSRSPKRVEGDPTRLRQVLNNLLSNAFKFADSRGVQCFVDSREADGGWAVTVRVRDFGPGIAADKLDRVFLPFDQTDVSVARTHGGTGLGLSLSRELARLMGGDLVVESTPGEGACFILSVWFRFAAQEAGECAGSEPVIAEPAANAGLKLLIADDHEINRRTLALVLGPLGASAVFAEDGEQALVQAATQRFDLIFMDVHMPGLDGSAATRRLRATPGPNRRTPVIAVTGDVSPERLAALFADGVTGWVEKPINAEELYAAVDAALAEPPLALSA